MGGRSAEGCTRGPRNIRKEETSWGQRTMEASFEGGQGPGKAVAPYMDGLMNGSMKY
jgi:hypothetical protein